MDSGYFDDAIFTHLEDQQLLYTCKAPLKKRLKKAIAYLEAEELWRELDETWAVAELKLPLTGWAKGRRFVFIRCRQWRDPKTGQLCLTGPGFDSYQAIVTNLEDMSPEDIWHFYNQRATIEPLIDELKEGFAVEEVSQHLLLRNQIYTWIKVIAYNLLAWFRTAVLPEEASSYEAETIRRKLLQVPAVITGHGRYRRIHLAPHPKLERLVAAIREGFQRFTNLVGAYLIPLRT